MDTTARILVETQQGVQNLKALQTQVKATNDAFAGLKNAILGFATISFVGGLYKMANEITDMAAATGIGTQAILGFGKAVSANGGTMDGATAGIAKFVQAIGSAAGGSKESQAAFAALGVSLQDLRTLSEEDLLKKATAGFKEGMNASEKLTLAVALFGKTARSWDMSKVNSELQTYIDKSKDAASATDAAGEVSQRFGNAYKELGSQILIALKPLSEVALMITNNKEALSTAIKVIVDFGAAWLIFAKIIPGVRLGLEGLAIALVASGGAMGALKSGLMGIVAGFTAFGANILRAVGVLPTAFGGVASLTFALSGLLRGLLRFAGIAGVFYGIYEAIDFLVKKLSGAGIVDWVTTALQKLGILSKATTDSAKNDKEKANAQRDVKAAVDEFSLSLGKTVDAYYETISASQKKYDLDLKGIGASREQASLNAMVADAETNYLKTVTDLREKYIALVAAGDKNSLAQAKQVATAMGEVGTAYANSVKGLPKQAADLERATVSNEALIVSQKSMADATQKVKDIQDEMAQSTMPELERLRAKALADANKLIDSDIAQAAAAAKLTVEEFKARNPADVAAYTTARLEGAKKIGDAEAISYENSRKFSTGWNQAFNDYAKNATDAAQIAKNVFDKFTSGLEDVFMNFFKTGKLDWKNFMASIVEEIARAQVKAAIVKLMSGLGFDKIAKTGGGAASAVAAVAGAATGAPNAQNEETKAAFFDLTGAVKEFATGTSTFLSSMFSGLGNFVSMMSSGIASMISSMASSLGGIIGGLGSTLWDIVSGLGSSLGDILGSLGGGGGGGGGILSTLFDIGASLFGFANGGVIPNNGPVLVGEKGPELLFGSQGAAVVPLGGGGSTNITYNINAVDAMSFKQMVAADPTFIYAVTQQGAKGMPGRR